MADKIVPEMLHRSLQISASGVGVVEGTDDLTVRMIFASGTAVDRGEFWEVLSMEGLDRERTDAGLPLLKDHNHTVLLGSINPAIVPDFAAQTYACESTFSRNPLPQEVLRDIRDGHHKFVSVGYRVYEYKQIGMREGRPVLVATRWMPLEISIVSVPADVKSTLKRALPGFEVTPEPKPEKLPVQVRSHNNKENKMDEETQKAVDAAIAAGNQRSAEIMSLGATHKADKLAIEFVRENKTIDEFRAALLAVKPEAAAVRSAKLDMSDKEITSYSFLRAMNAAATGDWRGAGLERDVSLSVAKATGKTARGFLVASDILTRASQHNVTTAADGGNLVGTDLRTESFIDALRHRTLLNSLGATILTDAKGPIAIPKEVGLMGVTWVGEDGVAVNTKAQFGQVAMNPKTVLAKTSISRRLMLQSAISIENFVRDRFQKAIALALDHAAFVGFGTAQEPKGIYTLLTDAQKHMATADAYADAVFLETMVSAENADVGSLAYVGNAKTRGALKVAQVFENSGKAVWGDTATPGVGMVNGYNAYATNHITGNAPLLFGNFASLFVAFWSGLDVVVDNITDDSGAHIIKVYQDADVALAHLESFAALKFA